MFKSPITCMHRCSFLIPSPSALARCSGSSLLLMGPMFLETLSIHMRLLPNLPLSHNVLSQSTRNDNLEYQLPTLWGETHTHSTPTHTEYQCGHSEERLTPFLPPDSSLKTCSTLQTKRFTKNPSFQTKNQSHFEKQLSYPPASIDIRGAPGIARVTHSVQTRWMIHRLAVFLNIFSLIALNKGDSRRNLACYLKVTLPRMLFLWTLYLTSF